MKSRLFMVLERFKKDRGPAVYARFREKGRMLPRGLTYLDSWVERKTGRCFQLMACRDRKLFRVWTRRWSDLVDFEILEVVTSNEAAKS